jgi:uncharacterized membrane protein
MLACFRLKADEGGKAMPILWGLLIVAAGLFMVICGTLRSEFILYRLMVYRSKILWGENVHRFYQIAGAMVIVFGLVVAFGYF